MVFSYPKYYEDFRCIADKCEDSCCQQWQVDVDAQAAAMYEKLPGAVGDRLRQVMARDSEDNVYLPIENGRCPMWRQDGLCQIQAHHGHDALCETCRNFPRLTHEYACFTEKDLELSCPEAARWIFNGNQDLIGEIPQCQDELLNALVETRAVALDFLMTSPLPLKQKLATVLLYAHQVQSYIDGGDVPEIAPEKALTLLESLDKQGDIIPVLDFYVNLEILTDRWKQRLVSPAPSVNWDERLCRFMTYGIRRYWLQAVSDYDLLCRVKFLVGGCILLAHLGGDLIATAQLWSKEIENDPDNVEALLDGAYTSHAFTDQNLLCLLNEGPARNDPSK